MINGSNDNHGYIRENMDNKSGGYWVDVVHINV